MYANMALGINATGWQGQPDRYIVKHVNRRALTTVLASAAMVVVDTRTGEVLASYQFAAAPTFVNDVVLTPNAAWFTDSQNR